MQGVLGLRRHGPKAFGGYVAISYKFIKKVERNIRIRRRTALYAKDDFVHIRWIYGLHWIVLHLHSFICDGVFLPFIMTPRRKSDCGI